MRRAPVSSVRPRFRCEASSARSAQENSALPAESVAVRACAYQIDAVPISDQRCASSDQRCASSDQIGNDELGQFFGQNFVADSRRLFQNFRQHRGAD